MRDDLTDQVAQLLEEAAAKAITQTSRSDINELSERLDEPLRVAIAGKVKAGKSTLLNALIGEELAPTDAGECTRIVTWYHHGSQPRVVLHTTSGEAEAAYFTRAGALDVDFGKRSPDQVDRLDVSWPIAELKELTLIDTPGISSISGDLSERALRVLTPNDDRPPVVDAVIYLLRHAHPSDIRFLEAFHDDDLAHGTPLNAVGVLSRADDIGSCRLDALDAAKRVAARYQAEPRLRRLCPVIVPVAGLLAHAAVSLREREYRAFETLAQAPIDECNDLLLTVDRFASLPSTIGVTELEREHLLNRVGLFGVRWCIEQIRQNTVRSATELAETLAVHSGLTQLRTVLAQQFTERSRILKARSALTGLESILRTNEDPDLQLLGKIEEIVSNTHAFEEVRWLNELRIGSVKLADSERDELERLLGGFGQDTLSRLQLPPNPTATEIRASAVDALERWQRRSEAPFIPKSVKDTARVAIGALEEIIGDTPDDSSPTKPSG